MIVPGREWTLHQTQMKKRLSRIHMFRRASLREYEAFVWRVYTRPKHILADDLPFFLKRQAE